MPRLLALVPDAPLPWRAPAAVRSEVPRPPGDTCVFGVRNRPASRFFGNAFDADPLPFTDVQGRSRRCDRSSQARNQHGRVQDGGDPVPGTASNPAQPGGAA